MIACRYGLPRARVVHLRRVDAEDDPLRVVVAVHQDLVAAHPHIGRDVARLRLADQRMKEEPVGHLERRLGQVLVSPVDRVPGLEGHDPLPTAVGERLLRLGGRQVAAHEGFLVVGQRIGLDRAGEAARALAPNRGDARMLVVGRQVDELGLLVHLALEDLLDRQPPERLAVRGAQLDRVADRRLEVGGQGDRDRPDLAAREPHLLAHGAPVLGAHEAPKRREASVCEQLEVGGLARAQLQRQTGLRATHSDRTPSEPCRPSGLSENRRLRPAQTCTACSRWRDTPRREAGCRARRFH